MDVFALQKQFVNVSLLRFFVGITMVSFINSFIKSKTHSVFSIIPNS